MGYFVVLTGEMVLFAELLVLFRVSLSAHSHLCFVSSLLVKKVKMNPHAHASKMLINENVPPFLGGTAFNCQSGPQESHSCHRRCYEQNPPTPPPASRNGGRPRH